MPGLRSPLDITHRQLQHHKHVPVTAVELFGLYKHVCCCSQGSPALRLHAGITCHSRCAEELQQGWVCRLGGFALVLLGLSHGIASIRQGGCSSSQSDVKHLCSLAFSAVLSELCLGLGNDMQALFLSKKPPRT